MNRVWQIVREGFEETSDSSGKVQDSKAGAAESGAISTKIVLADPQLAEVVAAWPALPEVTRQAVINLVRARSTD
jgi:hypothetical protein